MRKNTLLRKISAVSLAAVTAMSIAIPKTVSYADGYDTTAPALSSFELSSRSLNVGDTLTFTSNIVEEETGISVAKVYIHTPDNRTISADFNVEGGSSLTGDYTASLEITDDFVDGEYSITNVDLKDVNNNSGNLYYSDLDAYVSPRTFTVSNSNNILADTFAPTITSLDVEADSVYTEDSATAVVECHDDDLASISITYRALGYPITVTTGKSVNYDVTEIANDGIYRVELPTSKYYGQWQVMSIVLRDTNNNSLYYESLSDYGNDKFTVLKKDGDPDIDVSAPTIDSVTGSATQVIIPGIAKLNVSGSEEGSDSVTVSINVSFNGRNQFYNKTVDVVEGKYSADFDLSFDSSYPAGQYKVGYVSVTDTNNNNTNETRNFFEYTLIKQYDDVTLNTTLSNPNLVNLIDSSDEGSKFVINADSNTVSEDLFKAIEGENKTLVFDMDGIEWIFNGKDINDENIKDIDIATSIYESPIDKFGYEEGETGVIFDFASNGFLPGEATIKVKSDYITDKYNLSSSLYLACIRETVECEEELSYYDYEYPEGQEPEEATDDPADSKALANKVEYNSESNSTTYKRYIYDEDGNPVFDEATGEQKYEEYSIPTYSAVEPELVEKIMKINSTREELVQIENAGIKLDDENYITIRMNHNSSYILTDKLPKKYQPAPSNPTINNPTNTNPTDNTNPTETTVEPSTTNVETTTTTDSTTEVANTESSVSATNNTATATTTGNGTTNDNAIKRYFDSKFAKKSTLTADNKDDLLDGIQTSNLGGTEDPDLISYPIFGADDSDDEDSLPIIPVTAGVVIVAAIGAIIVRKKAK